MLIKREIKTVTNERHKTPRKIQQTTNTNINNVIELHIWGNSYVL